MCEGLSLVLNVQTEFRSFHGAALITGRALQRLNTWFEVNFKRSCGSAANPPDVSGLKHRADDGGAPSADPARLRLFFSHSFIFLWCKSITQLRGYENVFLCSYFCGFIDVLLTIFLLFLVWILLKHIVFWLVQTPPSKCSHPESEIH